MYCINCGVKLEDTEKCCPLCGVKAFHPDLVRGETDPLYPQHSYPHPQSNARTGQIILTTLTLIAIIIMLMCDVQINGTMLWSGYAVGGLLVTYVAIILPSWFRKPELVIFVPVTFLMGGIYLLYINYATGGSWFLSFAFPLTGCLGIIVTAMTALLRFLKRGRLYIFGGATILLGLYVLLVEILICVTFAGVEFVGWSLYPAVVLALLGGMLIVLAINRSAREVMERKFFI